NVTSSPTDHLVRVLPEDNTRLFLQCVQTAFVSNQRGVVVGYGGRVLVDLVDVGVPVVGGDQVTRVELRHHCHAGSPIRGSWTGRGVSTRGGPAPTRRGSG